MKTCSKCKIEKDFSEFQKDKKKKDGLRPSCKSCSKQYVEQNKERLKEYNKKYSKDNKEKISDYRKKNKERTNEYNKNYREKNKEKLKELNKKWYYNNKEKNKKKHNEYAKKYTKERKINDPIFKLKCNIRRNISMSFRKANNQFRKNAKTEIILGCTIEEFIKYIQSKFTKGMTLENNGKWHFDHIIPLATAKTEEDVIRLNHYTNFEPLWAKDNLSKGDKIIEKQLVLL
jgi:hypothetical protein